MAKYRLGGSTLGVGSAMLAGMAIRQLARPMMQAVSDERRDVMQQLRAADAATWPRRRRVLEAALVQHRKAGCCCSFGDWQADIHGIAIGFQPGGGLPAMALDCGGPSFPPSFRLPRGFLLGDVRPRLASVVRRLEDSGMISPGQAQRPRIAPPKRATRTR